MFCCQEEDGVPVESAEGGPVWHLQFKFSFSFVFFAHYVNSLYLYVNLKITLSLNQCKNQDLLLHYIYDILLEKKITDKTQVKSLGFFLKIWVQLETDSNALFKNDV